MVRSIMGLISFPNRHTKVLKYVAKPWEDRRTFFGTSRSEMAAIFTGCIQMATPTYSMTKELQLKLTSSAQLSSGLQLKLFRNHT